MNKFIHLLATYRITPKRFEDVCVACSLRETVVAEDKKSILFPIFEFAFSLCPASSHCFQLRTIPIRRKALGAVSIYLTLL